MWKSILLTIMGFSLFGCTGSRISTIWKNDLALSHKYNKILVVAVMPDPGDTIGIDLERKTVQELASLGYEAVSYMDGFSVYGISQLNQEAAYFTLCDKGIDCILTLAKTAPSLTISLKKGTAAKYSSSFYYNHIWNYRNRPFVVGPIKEKDMVWECILFDLNSLGQQGVFQINAPSSLAPKNEMTWVSGNIVNKMLSEKVLERKDPRVTSPRAF